MATVLMRLYRDTTKIYEGYFNTGTRNAFSFRDAAASSGGHTYHLKLYCSGLGTDLDVTDRSIRLLESKK